MSEDLFWSAPLGFLRGVSNNKSAFDNFVAYEQEKLFKK